MACPESGAFTGFAESTLRFLTEIRSHNDREWFEAHRTEYEQYVLTPLRALVLDLGPCMSDIDHEFELRPAVGRTISRIHRDTRFSFDKSPFRSTVWITFKRPSHEWLDRPVYFFELAGDTFRYGMGFYSAKPRTMERIRDRVTRDPAEFLAAVAFYPGQDVFAIEGATYKRRIANTLPQEIQTWYQRKNLYLSSNHAADARLLCSDLACELCAGFRMLAPLYRFLLAASARDTLEDAWRP